MKGNSTRLLVLEDMFKDAYSFFSFADMNGNASVLGNAVLIATLIL